jgi:Fic family protein
VVPSRDWTVRIRERAASSSATTLPVLEARASSEIENIVTTADRLFRFAQHDESEQADPATKEALRYQSALMQGLRELAKKPVTTGTAVEIWPALARRMNLPA